MEAVWPDSIVEENNLAQAISKLRQVFGETPGSHSYIVTVPGRGYRFVAGVAQRSEGCQLPPSMPQSQRAGLESQEIVSVQKWQGSNDPVTPWFRRLSQYWMVLGVALSVIVVVVLRGLFSVRHRSLPAAARAPNSTAPDCSSFICADAESRKERRGFAVRQSK